MRPGDWVIMSTNYGDQVGEVVKVTAKQLYWKQGHGRTLITDITAVVYSHADDFKVFPVFDKLKSAGGEYEIRIAYALKCLEDRRIEIIAAANQGDE